VPIVSNNFYCEVNLHVNWHTKENLPLLNPAVEQFVHRFLRQKIVDTPGVFVHQIGGTENHVHVVLTIPPTVLISDLIGQLKGASSHEANFQMGRGDKILQWQTGYGVVSFGTGDLEWVKKYVANQKEHHAKGAVYERLERVDRVEP
jgi:putative transposase